MANQQQPKPGVSNANECDANSDTFCLVINLVVLEYTTRTADVNAYEKEIAPLNNVPMVSVETAWDDLASGQTYIIFDK